MNRFLVSNISGRKHKQIYKELEDSAIFDLSPSQHGWSEFKTVEVGDFMYVINKNLNVALCYKVTKVIDGIQLDESAGLADKIISLTGGDVRVVFGDPHERIDMEYSTFVRKNNINSTKINHESNKMRQGFNCAAF